MSRILGIFLMLLIFSCSSDRTNRNPFLQEIGFRFDANLNLPLYSPLTNTGSAILVTSEGIGTRGVFIVNTGFNQFRAFEASCPNHDGNRYYDMLEYRATFGGNIVSVSN